MINESTDFQDYADFWAKKQLSRSFRIAKIYFKRTEKLKTKFFQHDWRGEAKNIEKVYHANKAIYFKANKNLPFTTLSLLGKLLSDKKHHETIKHIIQANVLTYNEHVYKLDDLEAQTKIRKALRTLEFSEVLDSAA
ncbi:MAG: hypothetical protein ACJAS4_000632 [Bacteriovoracaceae bacterium]|jgi:hypothetical protein